MEDDRSVGNVFTSFLRDGWDRSRRKSPLVSKEIRNSMIRNENNGRFHGMKFLFPVEMVFGSVYARVFSSV